MEDPFTRLTKIADHFPPGALVWGNGADFDNMMLASLYDACRLAVPWKYYSNRCYRTLKSFSRPSDMVTREGIHHNALDDAVHQAYVAVRIMRRMGLGVDES